MSPLCLACAQCGCAIRGQGQHLGEAVSSRQQEPLGTRLRLSASQGQMREDASRGGVHLNESPQSQNTERLPHQPSITDRSSFRPAASGGLCGNQGPRRGLGSGAAGGGLEHGVQATPPVFHGARWMRASASGQHSRLQGQPGLPASALCPPTHLPLLPKSCSQLGSSSVLPSRPSLAQPIPPWEGASLCRSLASWPFSLTLARAPGLQPVHICPS